MRDIGAYIFIRNMIKLIPQISASYSKYMALLRTHRLNVPAVFYLQLLIFEGPSAL